MSLKDKLLSRSMPTDSLKRKAIVRVLLDDQGNVPDVIFKRSCGDAMQDVRALNEIRNMRFARGQIGSKTSRRWHELAYAAD
jgi:outer membrane biosynthesis protein TonB